MTKMIQIRNVPEKLHRTLKAKAASDGRSLSDYLLRQIEVLARRPTMKEWLDMVAKQDPVKLSPGISIVDIVREGRDERDLR